MVEKLEKLRKIRICGGDYVGNFVREDLFMNSKEKIYIISRNNCIKLYC